MSKTQSKPEIPLYYFSAEHARRNGEMEQFRASLRANEECKRDIEEAIHLVDSPCLGITLCQGCFAAMGENIIEAIHHFSKEGKLFYVHFRDVRGTRENFHETFHDDGQTDMAKVIRTYLDTGFNGPIRVDHVPTLYGEENETPGYAQLGRLYAIGYLKGLIDANMD